ncbi:RNA polymerase sigma-70 factor (sigma-E family) [Nonomuraea thailandensis]|uniref:RNA polymerase sigma-70 factor (Sigma-E family) n=1 Tax=Nonomuraea thailandensis TaxID=1188745 RepID=A0A9X2G758_9ACTN|nr:SigE family RNA polymerase sigma factor [Nonomuraea thailandensis]MCP2353526.1 RNA polymerase sigma-70 factor (sigma-E family) [Nonomuraea thailandensis]
MDGRWFDSFVVHRYERLRHSAFLLTGDLGTAEDVVQSALAKAWVAWGRIKSNPDSYVYRILVNTHISWWRRKWRHELPSVDVPDHPDPHDFAAEVERRQALLTAIGGLSRRQRAIVVLHYFEQLTLTQCAEVLGTVKTQLGRALKRLRVDPEIQPAEVER